MDKLTLIKILKETKEKKKSILNLSNRKIREIPPEIGELINLKVLNLSRNELIFIPSEIGNLINLTTLSLNRNRLKILPSRINQLKSLNTLDISFNQLEKLPPEIGQLSNLERIYLSANKLQLLPPEIGELTNLVQLSIQDNHLLTLPAEIGKLNNLSELYLNNNQLTSLPKECGKLEKLLVLNLHDNPLEYPPFEIVVQGIDEIRNFLNIKLGSEYIYEAKMLILGQGGVGKTSLVKRLIDNSYNEEEDPTPGINIRRWEIEIPESDNNKILLNIWDFGGQEIYFATHQFFLSKRSIYIIVIDARQGKKAGRISYWLNTIKKVSDESPILIVLNKCEDFIKCILKDLNLEDIKEIFPQVFDRYKISCKTREGLDFLIEGIKKVTSELSHIGKPWSPSWLKVREYLENDHRSYISYEEYLQICEKNNVPEQETASLIRYLNDLGIIFHYHTNIYLKNIIILTPEWVTEAVYAFLNSEIIKNRDGVLFDSDLQQILINNQMYPEDIYPSLLKLMSYFDILFSIDKDESKYIVAELLLSYEKSFYWDEKDNLKFEYQYSDYPDGVIPRFIVSMNSFLIVQDGKYLCWKEGAYLQKNETYAFVKLFPLTNKIEIKIKGPEKREFLWSLRLHFDNIHNIENVKELA
ncbi:MAG: COR domain-containing protein, partial [Candidatus Hodarchaeota archaeon]